MEMNGNRQMKYGGQSAVEYLVLVAAVTIVCFVFLRPGGQMNTALDEVLNGSFNMINRMANEINILP